MTTILMPGTECWYCFWGWAKPVAEIYLSAVAKLGGDDTAMTFGPAHIVWEDENFEDDAIDFCLGECGKDVYEISQADADIVRESLLKLRAVPESVRCCEPESYRGKNPEQFPPGVEILKVR